MLKKYIPILILTSIIVFGFAIITGHMPPFLVIIEVLAIIWPLIILGIDFLSPLIVGIIGLMALLAVVIGFVYVTSHFLGW